MSSEQVKSLHGVRGMPARGSRPDPMHRKLAAGSRAGGDASSIYVQSWTNETIDRN
jgi:hypothetical protein